MTSGIIAPETLEGSEMSFEDEAASAMRALRGVLMAAGHDLGDVMRIEVFLAEPAHFPVWNDVFVAHWPDPSLRPARTTLTTGFVVPGVRIEVQALSMLVEAGS